MIAYRATLDVPRELAQFIGDIARAALVLTHFEHGYTTSIPRDQLTACAP